MLSCFVAAVTGLLLPASASSAITLTEGANTVSTSKFELNFDDGAGNVERLTTIRWRDGAGTLGGDLANEGGAGGAPCTGFTEFWGQSYATQDFAPPGPVVAGTTGTWAAAGGRTAEINGSAPSVCSGATPVVPVRTRYTFFDDAAAANMIRFERRFNFPPGSPVYGPINLRAFVPRLPIGTYGQVIYPNTAGTLTTAGTGGPSLSSNWNGTWVALNSGATNAGMVILRDPGNSEPARIVFDNDGFSASNNSGVSLNKPALGWQAPITETEYMCFYNATSWPVASRSPTSLPPGCSARAVPVNTRLPAISGPAGNPNPGSRLSASPGGWDHANGTFEYQWSRCEGASCTEIGGATNQEYTATSDDAGKSLKVSVTATSADGEKDSAQSSLAGSLRGRVYENSISTPLAGARVQACRVPTGGCRTATADSNGAYRIQVPLSGDYDLKAFPPSSSTALAATARVTVVDETESTAPDLILQAPQPPPASVSVTGPGVRGTAPGGVPVVHWNVPFSIRVYVSSSSSTVDAKIETPDGEEEEPTEEDFEDEPETPDDDDGTWEFEFPATNPLHGNAFIRITIRPPTPEDPDGEIIFPIYIDPSGFVRTTDGAALADATVTLYRSDFPDGPFAVVPNGSAVMSPSNRTNPDRSDAAGHFGWDVIAGYYKVRAERTGCHAPQNPGQPFVETTVMEIPPPVTNLDIRLACPASADPGPGPGPGPGTPLPVSPPPGSPLLVAPPPPRNAGPLLVALSLPRNAGTVTVTKRGTFTLTKTRAACPAASPGPCLLAVSVTAPPATTKSGAAKKALKLGILRFSVPAGKTRSLRGKLSRTGLGKLKRRKRIKVDVAIAARVPGGGAVTRSVAATLMAR